MTEQPAVTGIRAGLTIRGLDTHTPTADWLCTCGHHQRTTGRHDVTALTTTATPTHCPHRKETP